MPVGKAADTTTTALRAAFACASEAGGRAYQNSTALRRVSDGGPSEAGNLIKPAPRHTVQAHDVQQTDTVAKSANRNGGGFGGVLEEEEEDEHEIDSSTPVSEVSVAPVRPLMRISADEGDTAKEGWDWGWTWAKVQDERAAVQAGLGVLAAAGGALGLLFASVGYANQRSVELRSAAADHGVVSALVQLCTMCGPTASAK